MDESDRRYLRQHLPVLDFDSPFDISSCNAELQELYRLYGFDLLRAATPCEHYSGRMRLGGFKCVANCWKPEPAPTGVIPRTVVIAHGLFDHTGLYLKLVAALLQAGYTVFMPDFPGHGLSEGKSAAIDDFDQYANVIADSVLRLKNQPERFGELILLGQSTGAAAVLRFLLDQVYDSGIQRVILCAPLLKPRASHFIRMLFPAMRLLGIPVRRRFSVNSSDKAFCAFLEQQDPLQARVIPLDWIQAMLNWIDWFEQKGIEICAGRVKKLTQSVVILQGEKDDTVDWRYNLPRIAAVFDAPTICRFTDARHQLVNEAAPIREEIVAAMTGFLQDGSSSSE